MRESKELAGLILVSTIAAFVVLSLVVVFTLALRGTALPDVWDALFGLVIAIVSATGGWLAGNSGIGSKTGNEEAQP